MNSNIKDVFHIKDMGDGKRSVWMKIGTAFVNKDGSINAILDALPVDGRLHIRDRVEAKTKKENNNG